MIDKNLIIILICTYVLNKSKINFNIMLLIKDRLAQTNVVALFAVNESISEFSSMPLITLS